VPHPRPHAIYIYLVSKIDHPCFSAGGRTLLRLFHLAVSRTPPPSTRRVWNPIPSIPATFLSRLVGAWSPPLQVLLKRKCPPDLSPALNMGPPLLFYAETLPFQGSIKQVKGDISPIQFCLLLGAKVPGPASLRENLTPFLRSLYGA